MDAKGVPDTGEAACINGLATRWRATAAMTTFNAVAQQPDGTVVGAGPQGWQRFSPTDGALLGSWSAPVPFDLALLAVSGDGSFVIAGRTGSLAKRVLFSASGAQMGSWNDSDLTGWGPWLGTPSGFVALAFEKLAGVETATVRRFDANLVPTWSATLPTNALSGTSTVGLAESPTGVVLVAGTVPFDVGAPNEGRARMFSVGPAGQVDGGMWLGTGYARVKRLGPWMADGRLFVLLTDFTDGIWYRTGLYAWQPSGLSALGLDTSIDTAGMSKTFTITSDATVLTGAGAQKVAWIVRKYQGGGRGYSNCQQVPGELGVAILPAPVTPATVTLPPPGACAAANANCPVTTFPLAMLALPGGDFVVAGTVINCTGPSGPSPDGLNRSGWLGRYASGCTP